MMMQNLVSNFDYYKNIERINLIFWKSNGMAYQTISAACIARADGDAIFHPEREVNPLEICLLLCICCTWNGTHSAVKLNGINARACVNFLHAYRN